MTSMLYVANSGEDSISAVALDKSHSQIKIHLKNANSPRRLLLRGGILYHADSHSATVGRLLPPKAQFKYIVSKAKTKITPPQADYKAQLYLQETLAVGRCPTDLCAYRNNIFVICCDSNSIYSIRCSSFACESVQSVGAFPIGAAINSDRLAISELLTGRLRILDAKTLKSVAIADVAGMPLCVCKQKNNFIVATLLNDRQGGLFRISETDGKVSQQAFGSDCYPAGRIKYYEKMGLLVCANVWEDSISLVDFTSMRPVKTIPTGRMPDDIAIDEASGKIYVSCMQDDAVAAYNIKGELVDYFAVGHEPRGLAIFQGR